MTYTSGAVAKLFDVSRETIRQWTIKFEDLMSEGVRPDDNTNRQYDDDDLRLLAYVVQARQIGKDDGEIRADVAAGNRADLPADITAITASSATSATQIIALKNQIVALNEKLRDAQSDNVKQAGQIELLRQQLTDAQQQINKLNREIGRLEGAAGESD